MPSERLEEIKETRKCQPNTSQTNGQAAYHGNRVKREDGRGHPKGRVNFPLDLSILVEETARDVKILSAISVIKSSQIENVFYPYRRHRSHLTTRFVLLFYSNKV